MKVALCLSGQTRTLEYCYPTLEEYFILPFNCDVFVHTWESDNDIISAKNLTNILVEEQIDFDQKLYYTRKTPAANVFNTISMFYSIKKSNTLKRLHELKNGFQYDYVIRARTDVMFMNKIDLCSLNPRKIWFPDRWIKNYPYNDHEGLNDTFAVSSSKNMDKYSGAFLNIEKFWNSGMNFRAETILKWQIDKWKLNVDRINLNYEILRI